jgi:zinc ribbon protein
MSAPEPQRQRMILTEDGELREPDESVGSEAQPIFCTNCGTANRVNSRFCRSCGESLDEQALDPDAVQDVHGPGRKSKHSMVRVAQPQPVQQSASSVAASAIMMIFVAGMVISTAAITNSALLPIVILITWAVVEMARHGVLK